MQLMAVHIRSITSADDGIVAGRFLASGQGMTVSPCLRICCCIMDPLSRAEAALSSRRVFGSIASPGIDG